MTIIFDGRKLAGELEKKLSVEVADYKKRTGITLKVADIVVGNNPASILYANMKKKAAERIGILMEIIEFPDNAEVRDIIEKVDQLNSDNDVRGVLIQLPLPKQLKMDQLKVIDRISPSKDVDCMTSENLELLRTGKPRFVPATVKAIVQVIHNSLFVIHNSNVCVVGASGMVGKPLADYLQQKGANVVRCDEFTKDLAAETIKADLLISATGIPNLIKKEMVKPGSVVIDVGSPKGDVDFENVKDVASFITPVPGGVGPMTIISLLKNTLSAAKNFPTPDV